MRTEERRREADRQSDPLMQIRMDARAGKNVWDCENPINRKIELCAYMGEEWAIAERGRIRTVWRGMSDEHFSVFVFGLTTWSGAQARACSVMAQLVLENNLERSLDVRGICGPEEAQLFSNLAYILKSFEQWAVCPCADHRSAFDDMNDLVYWPAGLYQSSLIGRLRDYFSHLNNFIDARREAAARLAERSRDHVDEDKLKKAIQRRLIDWALGCEA